MRKLCKNCNSYTKNAEGKCQCAYLGIEVNETSTPPPIGYCWRKRAKLSPEELSRVRAEAGRKGGSRSGHGTGGTPTQQMCIRKMDHEVLRGYVKLKKISMAESVHRICKSLLAKYPNLKTELWRD